MPAFQNWIHKLEEGTGTGYLRITLGVLGVLGLFVWYNARSFHNFKTQEAMDQAQVARNLAQGKGYTTYFIRPLSIHLVQERNEKKFGTSTQELRADSARLKGMHPDIANAPGYPLALAGLMKVLPFQYDIDIKNPFWSIPPGRPGQPRQFWRHEPDFLISLFNQILFFGVVVSTFFLTRRLFDRAVAWTSAILLVGCQQLWEFCVSGLSTMMVMLIFMGVISCLVLIEESVREAKGSGGRLFVIAAVLGLLMGAGTLTRYSFGWLIIPVLVFLVLFGGTRRGVFCVVTAGVFVILLAPWLYRNWSLSGAPFGTATYAMVEGTGGFDEYKLPRSLSPSFDHVRVSSFISKFLNNSRVMIQNDLPKLGGTWAGGFFLVGLLLAFRHLAIRRIRYFIMGALVTLFVAQALGRTHLSEDSPDINTDNLLVLIVPLVMVFGVSLFFMLLDQINLAFPQLRYAIIGLFGFVMCLPLIFTFLPPQPVPLVFPPYYPPGIQTTGRWMNEDELMMSDVPWAVAWYGQRQCLWLTLNSDSEFFAVNDAMKPIRALYLTPVTLKNSQSLDQRWREDDYARTHRKAEGTWGWFVSELMVNRGVPRTFPLRSAASGYLPDQLFLTDWDRWKK
jgi:hypothetical protein